MGEQNEIVESRVWEGGDTQQGRKNMK